MICGEAYRQTKMPRISRVLNFFYVQKRKENFRTYESKEYSKTSLSALEEGRKEEGFELL